MKTYENVVTYADRPGFSMRLSRRERPHIILGGKSGRTPVALSNGVTEAWPCTLVNPPVPDNGTMPGSNGTGIWCPVDYCYTLVQPLAA